MFLATCPISGHYWEESRLNCPYAQPVPISDPIFSTLLIWQIFQSLTTLAAPHWTAVKSFLSWGPQKWAQRHRCFSAMLSRSFTSTCWLFPSSSSPRHCCFLCFGYMSKTLLTSHWCFGYCRAVLVQQQSFPLFPYCLPRE